MKRKTLVFITLFAIARIALAQETNNQSPLRSLVEAEREFSKASVAKGMRDAFIMNLADDATLFRPHAVAGKKWMIEHPARPGLLTWQPVYADVSSSSDLGYTTGPWEFRQKGPNDKEVAYGNFVTVWKQQADGTWKVVVDLGISNPPPQTKPEEVRFVAARRAASNFKKADTAIEQAALLNADREFARASEKKGAMNSYLAYAADDARLFREDKFPFIGKRMMRAALSESTGLLTWQPAKADVSSGGDLGYTYGTAMRKAKGPDVDKVSDAGKVEYFNYLRIWKKQAGGVWKVVLDVFNPCPPPQSN
jgi:ketosteroid isomerase-like protein